MLIAAAVLAVLTSIAPSGGTVGSAPIERPRQADRLPLGARFASNSPYALLVRYHRGERLEATSALLQWSDHDLEAMFAMVEALVLKAEDCVTCPNLLGDLAPRDRVPNEALELPLAAAVRAAIMLHAEADGAQRAGAGPVGVEQQRACPGRLANWAGRYAVLLARSPATRDFSRRFFVAMTQGCQWDACFDEAESWARRGLKQFPDDAQLLLDLGSVIEEKATVGASLAGAAHEGDAAGLQDEFRKAQRELTQAVSRDPNLVLAKVRLGRVLWRLGQTALAQKTLQEAITSARSPRPAYLAHLFLGQVYEDAHRLDQAAAEYRRALEIDPRAQAAAVALSHALLLAGDVEGSRRVLAGGLASAPRRSTPDVYWDYLVANAVDHAELFEALLREAQE
ncbi:MAG TPA: tetratricopeptide repeat protein [Vicinamibacteria bacterium]|nr:tetratricopeptide repeat protein [Vicinamibacteria bacterium]